MAQWKELPTALDPRVRRLVIQLRQLKDHSGLSMAALAGRTGYSSSSWERYLNGKKLAPPQAIRELAHITGADQQRLLALYEVAAESRDQEENTQPDTATTESAEAARPRGRNRRWILAAVLVPLVAVAGLLVTARPWAGNDTKTDSGQQAEQGEFVFDPGHTYSCDIHRRDGVLYAGRSDTQDAVLQQVATSWDVVEAQCLLKEHGYQVGGIDGAYGQLTERAVKRLQRDAGLVADGIVGPHTWEVLRG
jgi:transcriptional regulator with XRE-family HTH domain